MPLALMCMSTRPNFSYPPLALGYSASRPPVLPCHLPTIAAHLPWHTQDPFHQRVALCLSLCHIDCYSSCVIIAPALGGGTLWQRRLPITFCPSWSASLKLMMP